MLIGQSGHTRVEEIILAVGLQGIALRTAMPIGQTSVYGAAYMKVAFGILLSLPGIVLLFARSLPMRKRGLFWVFVTYSYVGVLVPIVDWTRFGTSAGLLTLAAITGYLYYVTAREIHGRQHDSGGHHSARGGADPPGDREIPLEPGEGQGRSGVSDS